MPNPFHVLSVGQNQTKSNDKKIQENKINSEIKRRSPGHVNDDMGGKGTTRANQLGSISINPAVILH